MQYKSLPIGSRILLWCMCAGVLWLWISLVIFRPDSPSEFSTVTGTLVSADEHISLGKGGRSGYLDIQLEGSKVRYCVPADGYLDYFHRDAFFAEVAKGTTVQLTALARDIASPRRPLLNTIPTVFVWGVRAGGRDYCTVADHIAWQKRNNWWNLGIAAFGTAFLTVLFIEFRRRSEVPEVNERRMA